MKKIFLSIFIICLATTALFGQELTGAKIIDQVNKLLNPQTVYSKAEMIITTTSGSKRTFIYDSWSKDHGEKNLVRYLSPRRTRGLAVLMRNFADDIWMYFPKTKRVRKLATHAKRQKMQGSDFSYEDMGSGNTFIEDFTAIRMKDEKKLKKDCYKIECTRKSKSDVGYSRIIMWVLKENYVPIVIDYYSDDDKDELEKTLIQSNIKIIQEIPTALKMVMLNRLDNSTTEMKLNQIKYNLKLNESDFTPRRLKK